MNPIKKVLFITSYPPRECGIATFTKDTINAIEKLFGKNFSLKVAALNENGNVEREYPPEVIHQIQKNKEDYIRMAKIINEDDSIGEIIIEHEFGLYAGEFGSDLLAMTEALKKPYILVLHTVLSLPPKKMRSTLSQLIYGSTHVLTMTTFSRDQLINLYDADPKKVYVVPHGFHLRPTVPKDDLKAKYGCENKIVLSTFGLISRNKGIENALDAIAEIKDKDLILYFILGKTHPEVVKHEGEVYREFLMDKIRKHGIESNITFVNKFLELDELLEYLHMTDIYLFTSIDAEQAISGTLTYALGAGCAVLTTPISHAQEILDENAAMSFGFGNSLDLAQKIEILIEDEKLRKELGTRAKIYSSKALWENIAISYADLIAEDLHFDERLIYNKPEINLHHLKFITDHNGIFQFTNIDCPDKGHGYTLDDNARALYVIIKYQELFPNDNSVKYLEKIYLQFILDCQQPNGTFLNYVDINGNFTDQNYTINPDEASARAVLALTTLCASPAVSDQHKIIAHQCFKKSLDYLEIVMSPRAVGKILKALHIYNQKFRDHRILDLIYDKADYLMDVYNIHSTDDWHWFEPYLSYSNSDISEGLLYAYLATQNEAYKKVGLESLKFLITKMDYNMMLIPVSHRSKITKGSEEDIVDFYGQQPVELASLVECLSIAYQITREEEYYKKQVKAFTWFLGNNLLRQVVYNPATGGGYDGIEMHGININQGAESTLSYIISLVTMEKNFRAHENIRKSPLTSKS